MIYEKINELENNLNEKLEKLESSLFEERQVDKQILESAINAYDSKFKQLKQDSVTRESANVDSEIKGIKQNFHEQISNLQVKLDDHIKNANVWYRFLRNDCKQRISDLEENLKFDISSQDPRLQLFENSSPSSIMNDSQQRFSILRAAQKNLHNWPLAESLITPTSTEASVNFGKECEDSGFPESLIYSDGNTSSKSHSEAVFSYSERQGCEGQQPPRICETPEFMDRAANRRLMLDKLKASRLKLLQYCK